MFQLLFNYFYWFNNVNKNESNHHNDNNTINI